MSAVVVLAAIVVALYVMQGSADAAETADSSTMQKPIAPTFPIPQGVIDLAAAIERAEGSNPAWNNPLDLALGDQGHGVANSVGVTIFASRTAGLNAGYGELQFIQRGASAHYNNQTPLSAFAVTWTGNDNAAGWLATVIADLRGRGYDVDEDTPVGVLLSA